MDVKENLDKKRSAENGIAGEAGTGALDKTASADKLETGGKDSKEKGKKQIPLRLSASMYQEIAAWAEDEFRSVNGQIEYLLNECIKDRKRRKNRPE